MEVQRAARDERWKLIAYPQIGCLQLFDLQNDPRETSSLIGRRDVAAQIARLHRRMKARQTRVGDTLGLPEAGSPSTPLDLTGRAEVPDQWQPDWVVKKYFEGASRPEATP